MKIENKIILVIQVLVEYHKKVKIKIKVYLIYKFLWRKSLFFNNIVNFFLRNICKIIC